MNEEQKPYQVIDRRIDPDPPAIIETTSIVMVALQKGYDPSFIEKMMELQERNEKNEARRAFYQAVADFKAEAPTVTKDKDNSQFRSKYTSLGNLLSTYGPCLGKHGLSLSFPTPRQDEGTMTVECRMSHRLGHSESIALTGPLDVAPVGRESGRAARNPLQNIRSTFTYLRAATTEAILGVAGTEGTFDDDGNGSVNRFVTEEQAAQIHRLLQETGADKVKFLSAAKAEKVEEILAEKFDLAIAPLKLMKKAKGEVKP